MGGVERCQRGVLCSMPDSPPPQTKNIIKQG